MKQCNIDPSALSSDTQDRSAWRTLCHAAVTQFEDSRVEALEHKRAVRKGVQPRSNLSAWPCDNCSRVCSSRIGLQAHQQTYRWQAIRRSDGAVQSVAAWRHNNNDVITSLADCALSVMSPAATSKHSAMVEAINITKERTSVINITNKITTMRVNYSFVKMHLTEIFILASAL